MKLIKNKGNDRVMDALRSGLSASSKLDIATPAFSVFAFAEFATQLQNLSACRLVLPDGLQTDLQLVGSESDRAFRNQLLVRWLAHRCADWLTNRVEVRNTQTPLPQSSLIATDSDTTLNRAITGHSPFTTDGLGLTPGNPFSLIQCSETPDECATLQTWFTKLWESLPASPAAKQKLLAQLSTIPEPLDPSVAEQKAAADFCKKLGKPQNIAEMTKERLRRSGKKVREEWKAKQLAAAQEPELPNSQSETAKPQLPDLGFRVFKLASSNIQAWEPDRERLAETLEASVEHLKTDRTESDILFELLLKLGLDLTVPIERRTIAAQEVHNIGAGTLLVCLSKSIAAKQVEPLALGIAAWHKTQDPVGESTIVFRDSAFADDVSKTNLTAILEQHGLENIRSL